jgi:hypothetical protein
VVEQATAVVDRRHMRDLGSGARASGEVVISRHRTVVAT